MGKMINPAVLKQRLDALATFSLIDPEAIATLGKILEHSTYWELDRINPLEFARKHDLDEVATIDLFVHAARVGLFDFEWHTVCPMCGGTEHGYEELSQLDPDAFHCTMCDMDANTELDNQVEVTFTINPGVAELDINPFADLESYLRYYYPSSARRTRPLPEYLLGETIQSFTAIEPDEASRITFEVEPGQVVRILSLDRHSAVALRLIEEVSDLPQVVQVDVLPSGLVPPLVSLPDGSVTAHVSNRTATTIGALLVCTDRDRVMHLAQQSVPETPPFLAGKMLLNSQSFRDLFRIQTLPDDLRLRVGNLTVLFTDLRGSTELYSRTGDVTAYQLVQNHFETLKSVIRSRSGAIIKTIGDAVMATFSTPQDGLIAALDIMDAMRLLGAETLARDYDFDMGIKVGLHSGSALAVKANEALDYFGQTVNIAARVQGLAEVGEIWITESVYEAKDTPRILAANGYSIEKQSAQLRGIEQPTIVYKCECK
jgi:class 3 adenylate cyclase